MKNAFCTTVRHGLMAAAIGLATLGALPAAAQTVNSGTDADASVGARQQYEVDLAICNGGDMAAPRREACVRTAGQRYDLLRGAPAPAEATESVDGRATVMTPSSQSSTLRGSTITTTSDGRANVVVPETSSTN